MSMPLMVVFRHGPQSKGVRYDGPSSPGRWGLVGPSPDILRLNEKERDTRL
jgi:hypothetical protein